jgi:hypothetical protein
MPTKFIGVRMIFKDFEKLQRRTVGIWPAMLRCSRGRTYLEPPADYPPIPCPTQISTYESRRRMTRIPFVVEYLQVIESDAIKDRDVSPIRSLFPSGQQRAGVCGGAWTDKRRKKEVVIVSLFL